MELRTSERKRAKMKMGLQGPSGSGKTYSSLLLASGLTNELNNVAVIDTADGSADLYAHLGEYKVLRLTRPFTPERYITAIETCEQAGMEVIILDSITMEWETLLEIHGQMPGNSFANWSKITPRHNAFIHKILQSPCHVIATIRSKQDYVLSEKNGKYVPEKVGLKGITRDGMDYEFTVVFDLDLKHNASASKDRTGLFMDQPSFVITQGTGKRILKWCDNGVELEKIKQEIKEAQTVETLRDILNRYPDYRKEIEPLCIAKKETNERVEAININNEL